MLLLSLAASLLSLSIPKAQASINCTEYLKRQGSFSFQRYETQGGDCFFSVDPFNPPSDFKYRSFLLTGSGSLMVFNSYSTGNGSDQHGARVFYFFPHQIDPDMKIEKDQTVAMSATPGFELHLSQDQHRVVGARGGVVKESALVSPSNFGGIEFSEMQFLYLDSGFRLGEDPTGVPGRTSKFIDPNNHSCSVKNSEIFDYSHEGEPVFKFTDSELKKFLASRCPGLKVNF